MDDIPSENGMSGGVNAADTVLQSSNRWRLTISGIVVLLILLGIVGSFLLGQESEPPTERELQEQVADLMAVGNPNRCEEVNDKIYEIVCRNNIALNLAQKTKDISYCQQIDNELVSIADCEYNIILSKSIEREDVTACEEITSEMAREKCEESFYREVALVKNSAAFCSNAETKELQDQCHNEFLIATVFLEDLHDFDCSQFRGSTIQQECVHLKDFLASSNITDSSFCNEIASVSLSRYCFLITTF